MNSTTIREAQGQDKPTLLALLETCHMEQHGILAPGTRYWLAASLADEVVGVVGMEFGAGVALLRSASVHPEWRGRLIGERLMQQAMDAAQAYGATCVYLFSTGAGAYWRRHGFREVPVDELVAAMPDTPQVLRYRELGWLPTEVAWRREL